MYSKKLTALLLAFIILVGTFGFTANAVSMASELSSLEEQAVNYVENFAKVSYLYDSHDLSKGTLMDYYNISDNASVQRIRSIPLTEKIELCGNEKNVRDLCENLAVFKTTASFFKQVKKEQKIIRTNFTMNTNVVKSYIRDSSAEVQLYTHITFNYAGDPQIAEMGDNYTVYFQKINNDWYIADVFSEEIENCGYGDILSTFDERLAYARVQMEETETEVVVAESQSMERAASAEIAESDLGTYNAARATAYAYTYTTQSHTGSGNNSSFMNPIYPDFSSYGGNCANFVSQCLYAGLGGNDEAASLSGGNYPMHYADDGWYYSNYDYPLPWSCADDLMYYSFGTNGYSNTRLRGTKAIVQSGNTSFANAVVQTGSISSIISVASLPGAILSYKGTNSWHTSIITDATGLAYSQIKICENSPMRKAVTLQDRGYSSYKVYYFKPHYMIEDTTCGANSSHNIIAGCCRCRNANCNYTALCVWGSTSRPIPVNTTMSVTGSANTTCYRMAIGITDPGGNTTWYTATNTSVILRSYTFSQKGLYTITISGRDLAETNTWTSTDSHVFKIRVY